LIYLIPNSLLVIITHNDYFIKDSLKVWSKDSKLYRYHLLQRGNTIIRRFKNSIKNLLQIKRILETTNFQILFFEWGAGLLGRVTRLFQITKPTIVRLHRYEIFQKRLYNVNFDKINKIIVVSEAMKQEFLKKFPTLQDKIIIIPNSIKLEKFYPPPYKDVHFNICTLSHVVRVKRLDLILEAMKGLNNPKIKWYVGGDGVSKKELKQKIKAANLEDRVIFDGWVNKTREWFEDKDLIINASDIESFGLALIEAMACGVIPLIRGWSAAKDIYPNEYLLPYDETSYINSLTQRINEFFELKKSDLESKRKFAREYIIQRYSFQTQLQSFEKLFTSLLKPKEIQLSQQRKKSWIRRLVSIFSFFLVLIDDLLSPLFNNED